MLPRRGRNAASVGESSVGHKRVLSGAQIADFERDGYLVVRRMFDPAEMVRIAGWTDEVHDLPEVPGKYLMYFEQSRLHPETRILNRIEDFTPYHQGFEELFASDRMRGAVAQLLGQPAVLFKEKINFKLPGGDGFKPHQDQQAGWSAYADFFITAMVSIDEATIENGCLEVVAGHHSNGLVGDEWRPLDDEQMKNMEFVPYATKPGDVVYFGSFAPHASAPNLTDTPRRVLYVTYNRASAGDHRSQYYADKRDSYPPDIEREAGKEYVFRV